MRESSPPFFTNPGKVFFPKTADHPAYTKVDVAAYYAAVAGVVLPHVSDRPMVMRRYPHGISGDSFFHKNYEQSSPEFVRKMKVWGDGRETVSDYVVVDNVETLLWIVQLGGIELHPWLSKAGDCARCADGAAAAPAECALDHPDLLVFDVDPYVREGRLGVRPTEAGGEPGISREDYEKAVEVALLLRDTLRALGIRAWPKTSGKRGIHVYVPVVPKYDYGAIRAFAKQIGAHLAASRRDLVTTEYSKEKRAGRVFFDYNQNVRGKTLASPWSVRPTPEASVSMPLAWDALAASDPASFTIANVPELVTTKGDPWADYAAQDLDSILGTATGTE